MKSAPPHVPAPATGAPDPADAAFVTLAKIVRVRGRIGEVAATILTDFPERLTKLRQALLLDPAGRRRDVRIRRCWLATSHGGQAIFHFEGVNSINDAQQFVGCEVQLPIAQRAPLPAGRFFVTDLIGCKVFEVLTGGHGPALSGVEGSGRESTRAEDSRAGGHGPALSGVEGFSRAETAVKGEEASAPEGPGAERLGTVRDVYLESGTPLLAVSTPNGGELLIPFADEICTRIDPAARRIEVRLPPGLRELNQ